MRPISVWAGALILVGVLGCSSQSADDEETDDALTATEASTELAKIVAHPETSLRGVGDAVLRVQGAKEVWSFYPFHADTTVKTEESVADDTESAFLVVGSSGAILLVDVATGAGAASVPEGTTTQEVAAQLEADLDAANAAIPGAGESTTSSIHTNALPGAGLVDSLETKLTTTTGKIAAKLKEGGLVARAVATTKEKAGKVVAYFTGREAASTTATPDPTPAPSTPTAPPATSTTPETKTSKLLKGPAEVALAIEKLAKRTVQAIEDKITGTPSAEERAIPVESVTTKPDHAFTFRRSSHADVLKTKTSAEVAVTAEDAKKLVSKQPESVWTPGSDPSEVAPLWTGSPPHAEFVVGEDVPKSSLQKLKDAGHKAVWVVRAETVKAIEEVKADLPIHKDEPVAETRSDGAHRGVLSAAKTYLVKGWDESLLKLSDEQFMKSPIFQAIDALASRSASGDALPKIELVGLGVPEDLLSSTIKRAMDLLKKVGVEIAEAVVRPSIHGATPSKAAPPPTTPPSPTPTPTPAPTPAPGSNGDPSSSWDAGSSAPSQNDNDPLLLPPSSKADAGASKHAAKAPMDNSGCAIATRGQTGGESAGGLFVIGLAALSLRRRRQSSTS